MTQIKVTVTGAAATAKKYGLLTTGMVGVSVIFTFSPEWEGLNKIPVFQAGNVKKDNYLTDGCSEVPHEVLTEPGRELMIGVEGRSTDGTLVIPTIWASAGRILSGANTAGDPALEATPSQFDRFMAEVEAVDEKINSALTQAMESGAFDGPKGDQGEKGEKGETGDPFTYEDFTPEQLAALKGEKGDQGEKGEKGETGDPFTYEDFTLEQLAALKGEKGDQGEKGEKGEPFTYDDFTAEQLELLKGEKGDTGEKGDQGEKGDTGEIGPQGPEGEAGQNATINGVNALTLTAGKGIKTTQDGSTCSIEANYSYGTTDLVAGSSSLETGKLHFVYE